MPLAAPDKPASVQSVVQLRILQTTDLHGHVLAYDYHRDAPSRAQGLSLTATLIGSARAHSRLSLLFDSGDFLQGSPLSDRHAHTNESRDTAHPVVSAMNLLGYDAVTLGNHDLDFGTAYLAEALSHADFPVVSANITLPGAAQEQLKRHVLLKRRSPETGEVIKIGVTGCLPRDTLAGSPSLHEGVKVAPVKPALEQAVRALKALGADVIVVLAHCGLGDGTASDNRETIRNTITQISGIDVVLGGHTHEVFPAPQTSGKPLVNGCSVVVAGAWGTHLGQVDLGLHKASARWQITPQSAAALPVTTAGKPAADVTECPTITRNASPAHDATRAELGAPVGQTIEQIDSHFSLVRNDTGLQLIAAALEAKARSLLINSGLQDLPLLSAATPFKTGARAGPSHYCMIPAGTIAKRDISDLYGYADRLCVLRMTGAGLRTWLEQSASVFNQIKPGAQDAPLLDPAFPGYFFDVIPQLTYAVNIAEPARFDARRALRAPEANRIEDLCYMGMPVADSDAFMVAANSFRAYAPWPNASPSAPAQRELLLDSGLRCSGVLEHHISAASPLAAPAQPSWRFAPVASATASFLTAPEALHNCPSEFTPLGLSPDGFAKMRLTLG